MKNRIKIAIVLIIISILLGVLFFYIAIPNFTKKTELIGGCAGVHMIYWEECCEKWAEENSIMKSQCIGNWTVEDNQCKWICSSE